MSEKGEEATPFSLPGIHSFQQPPLTFVRPLPPLPAHLQRRVDSRPSSPDTLPQTSSSSTSSTPNANSPLVPSPEGAVAPTPISPVVHSATKRARGGTVAASGNKKDDKSNVTETGDSAATSSAANVENGTSWDQKPAKRVRVGARASIACGTCRRRKVRCSAEWPTCTFCSARSLKCEYDGHPAEHGGSLPDQASGFVTSTYSSAAPIEVDLPSLTVLLEALDTFYLHNYYTFYFIHRPSLTESIKSGTAPKELLCCILAFAARFNTSLKDLYPGSPSAAANHFASLANHLLANPTAPASSSSSPTLSPADLDFSLTRCQCYLILGMFECTDGSENKGWMKIGTAIRMAQVLRLGFQDEEENSRGRPDPLQAEIRRRTFWSCFLLDRTITDGKERPCSLKAPLPLFLRMPGTDTDFLLGRSSTGARFDAELAPWHISAKLEASGLELEADLYGQTLRVAELWNRVVSYVGSGGRNYDRRPPWLHESTFATLEREINAWEATLPGHYSYNDANLVAHCMIGQGRLFGMLHLLFACSNLILHRDYLPFLPGPDFKAANGPIDGEPLYGNAVAPPEWWERSLGVAFESAGIISDLCTTLSQHGSQITHPFAGFAALAAGTLHAHLKFWPQSYRKPVNSTFYFDQDVNILASLKGAYPIASIWCDGIARLNLLYSNLVRGVIDVDPSKVRSSVIKLLRTARDDEASASPARPLNAVGTSGSQSNSSSAPSSITGTAPPVGNVLSLFEPANQFPLDSTMPSDLGTLNGEFSLDEIPMDDSFWGTWNDFSLFGFDAGSGSGGAVWS
ncbi:hypothetical protein T439DRAFT_320988 [Meredithblackwellia eburnea MCA 4105]